MQTLYIAPIDVYSFVCSKNEKKYSVLTLICTGKLTLVYTVPRNVQFENSDLSIKNVVL